MKVEDKFMASEREAVVGSESEAVGAPMARSSMECTDKNSNSASTPAIYNR